MILSRLIVVLVTLALFILPCTACPQNVGSSDDPGPDYSDLPACSDFASHAGWFTIPYFTQVVDDFKHTYLIMEDFIPGTVELDGKNLRVLCDGWSFSANWLKDEGTFPLQEGQEVFVTAGTVGFNVFGHLWVVGEEGETLLFQTGDLHYSLEMGGHELGISGWEVCEYRNPEAMPPPGMMGDGYSAEWEWLYVLGLAVSGHVESSDFWLNGPGTVALTEDQKYYAILPYAYSGVSTEWDENTSYDGSCCQVLFQLVRAQTPEDDDDSLDKQVE